GVRRRAGRRGDADVVERHHAPLCRERVHERWVPVVEVAAEVLQEDEGHSALAGVAVGVLDAVTARDSLSRHVGVRDWHLCLLRRLPWQKGRRDTDERGPGLLLRERFGLTPATAKSKGVATPTRKRPSLADPKAPELLRKPDPVLARLTDARPDFRPRAGMEQLPPLDAFGTLIFQVAGQQLSVNSTRAIISRLQQRFGG